MSSGKGSVVVIDIVTLTQTLFDIPSNICHFHRLVRLVTSSTFYINPFVPSVLNKVRLTKIEILIQEGILRKIVL